MKSGKMASLQNCRSVFVHYSRIWNQVPEKFDNADPQCQQNEAEVFSLEDSVSRFLSCSYFIRLDW